MLIFVIKIWNERCENDKKCKEVGEYRRKKKMILNIIEVILGWKKYF